MKKQCLENRFDDNNLNEMVRLVLFWIVSFVPFVISAILFVFCFYFEKFLWLYVVCATVLAIFVCMYIHAEKSIRHKDGYTLIQAMHFYLVCLKAGILQSNAKSLRDICGIADKFEYANKLKSHQVDNMYKIGGQLVHYFKIERLSRYV